MKIIITVILALFFAFPVFAQAQAEVIVPTTFLRKLPNSTAEKVYTIQQGAKITFEKTQNTNGWYYVSTQNGKVKGWINGNTIRSAVNAETANQTAPATGNAPETAPIASKTPETAQTRSETAPEKPQTAAPTGTPAREIISSPTPKTTEKPVSETTEKTAPAPVPTPRQDEEVLRIETEEVNLNVRVVDTGNRPVNNLNQAQFEVYEDDVLQPITSLKTAEVPINYALVVDNSRSLRAQLEKVIEAGKIIVGTNRPVDESTVVRFVSADKIEVVQDFTVDKNLLGAALDNLFIEGGQTAIIDAVYLTAKRVAQYEKSRAKDDVKRRALIVVSDGDDRNSSYKEQQLFDLLRETDVQIYVVGFINDLKREPGFNESQSRQEKAKAFLTRLAEETGGKVYFPNSIDELPQIAANISDELRTQYLVTYAPTNQKRDDKFRNIRVIVKDGTNKEKRIAITRAGRISKQN